MAEMRYDIRHNYEDTSFRATLSKAAESASSAAAPNEVTLKPEEEIRRTEHEVQADNQTYEADIRFELGLDEVLKQVSCREESKPAPDWKSSPVPGTDAKPERFWPPSSVEVPDKK